MDTTPLELLAPTDSYVTWERTGAVKLRFGNDRVDPVLMSTLLINAAATYPEHSALAYRVNGRWTYINYREYHQLVRQVARAFIKLGLEARSTVVLMGFNTPEWYISYMAAIFSNGIACGMYKAFTSGTCELMMTRTQASIVIVDDDEQLSKVLAIRHKLASLHAIIHYNGSIKDTGVYSWSELLCIRDEATDADLDERMKGLRANMCCSILFTSGTTGTPKAAMLSHDNVTWCIMAAVGRAEKATGVKISYRPMAHGSCLYLDLVWALCEVSTVFFVPTEDMAVDALKTFTQVKPKFLFGSPIIWKAIGQRIKDLTDKTSGLWRWALLWARSINVKTSSSLQNGESLPYGGSIADLILRWTVRKEVGLDRCFQLLTGGAPTPAETIDSLASVGLYLNQLYASTETGLLSMNVIAPGQQLWRPLSVGKPIPAVEIELRHIDENGNGEIYVGGRSVFMGYLGDEEQSIQAFDERWKFRTGDVGRLDDDGFLYISGRVKEMIITSGATNIFPGPMENAFVSLLPVVSNCVIFGDGKDFLVILLCFKSEIDISSQEPTNAMATETRDWCRQLGSQATTISDVAGNKDEAVNQAVQRAVDDFNQTADRPAKKLRRFYILPKDFSAAGGELGGPLLKMMRSVINEKYKNIIQRLFSTEEVFDNPEIPKI